MTRTILFLHGLGTTSRMWDEHIKLLPEFTCLKPDLPGHGSASGRPWVSLAQTTAEIAAVIEGTAEGRAHVVGLSLGGAVAIELMNTRPELLDHVILDGVQAVSWRFGAVASAGAAAVSPLLHSRLFLRPAALAMSIRPDKLPGFYREFRMVDRGSFRRSVRHFMAGRLRSLDFPGPVLLVAGAHDVGATRVSNATLARLLPNASAWYAPRGFHAWVSTNPDLHRAMVRAFVLDQPLPEELVRETSRPRASETG